MDESDGPMRKGIALQLPEVLFDQIETVADSEYDGDRNEAIQALIKKGLEHDDWVNEWKQASLWHRLKWVYSGEFDYSRESA